MEFSGSSIFIAKVRKNNCFSPEESSFIPNFFPLESVKIGILFSSFDISESFTSNSKISKIPLISAKTFFLTCPIVKFSSSFATFEIRVAMYEGISLISYESTILINLYSFFKFVCAFLISSKLISVGT